MAKLKQWSVSKLKTYQSCPYQFYCNHILKMYPEGNQKALTFGSCFHEVAEFFFNGFKFPTQEEFIKYYEEHWIAEQYVKAWNKLKTQNPESVTWSFLGYESASEEQEFYHLGKMILIDFWNKHVNYPKLPFAVELGFNEILPTGDLFVGFIDRVDYFSGLFRLLDYKTGKWESSTGDLKNDLQLLLYHWAFCKKYNIPYTSVEYCALYYVRSCNLVPVTYYNHEIEKALETTTSIITKVDSDYFPKTPKANWLCKNCPFKGNPCDSARS